MERLISESFFSKDHNIPDEMLKVYERAKHRAKVAKRLVSLSETLEERLNQLQQAHDQVKSKSLVMQSLWDGLVDKQVKRVNVDSR